MPPDLDRWLREPAVRTRHRRESSAGVEELWRAAATVTLDDATFEALNELRN